MKLALFFKLSFGVFSGAFIALILFFLLYCLNHSADIGFDGPAGSVMVFVIFVGSIVGGVIGSRKLKQKYPGRIGLPIVALLVWIFVAVCILSGVGAHIGTTYFPDGSPHPEAIR